MKPLLILTVTAFALIGCTPKTTTYSCVEDMRRVSLNGSPQISPDTDESGWIHLNNGAPRTIAESDNGLIYTEFTKGGDGQWTAEHDVQQLSQKNELDNGSTSWTGKGKTKAGLEYTTYFFMGKDRKTSNKILYLAVQESQTDIGKIVYEHGGTCSLK